MSGKPYQSKLIPYQYTIMTAWYRRKTLKEIQEMRVKEKVKITISGIAKFTHRQKKKADPHDLPLEFKQHKKTKMKIGKAMKKIEALMKRDPDEIKKEWFEKQYSGKTTVSKK